MEQHILEGFTHVPMRTAKLKTELIDVDLVRGNNKLRNYNQNLTVKLFNITIFIFIYIYNQLIFYLYNINACRFFFPKSQAETWIVNCSLLGTSAFIASSFI